MTPVRLEPAAPRSRVKHSTTEPLRSYHGMATYYVSRDGNLLCAMVWQLTMYHGMATYYVSWDGNLLCVMGWKLTSVSWDGNLLVYHGMATYYVSWDGNLLVYQHLGRLPYQTVLISSNGVL